MDNIVDHSTTSNATNDSKCTLLATTPYCSHSWRITPCYCRGRAPRQLPHSIIMAGGVMDSRTVGTLNATSLTSPVW